MSRLAIAGLACALAACAQAPIEPAPAPPAPAKPGLVQPTAEQELECKVKGFVFHELGIMRDQGRDQPTAVAAIQEKITALAHSPAEKKTAAHIVATAKPTTAFVYALPRLEPMTLTFFGANVCLMQAAGDWDSKKAVSLSQYAEACQKEYPPASAKDKLRACITNEAVRLVRQQ